MQLYKIVITKPTYRCKHANSFEWCAQDNTAAKCSNLGNDSNYCIPVREGQQNFGETMRGALGHKECKYFQLLEREGISWTKSEHIVGIRKNILQWQQHAWVHVKQC